MARSHAVGAAQALFKELCEIVTEVTGTVFYAHHALSYRELSEALEHGDLGVAWMPPIPAIELEDKGVAAPLALPSRRGSTSYHAAFITRRGGPKSLAELQGRRVAWVDRESAAGYLVPRMHLASLGYDATTYFAQESFAQSHFGVVEALVSGRVDAGATFCTLEPGSKRVITAGWTAADGATIRPVDVLATMGPIPNDAIVAAARMPASVKAALTRWLLDVDGRSREILTELFHASTLRLSSPAHFEPLRHMLRAARARGYDVRTLRPSMFPSGS
jgi:ABC-type phosphate/phosphonate transport system substrate-binding protein